MTTRFGCEKVCRFYAVNLLFSRLNEIVHVQVVVRSRSNRLNSNFFLSFLSFWFVLVSCRSFGRWVFCQQFCSSSSVSTSIKKFHNRIIAITFSTSLLSFIRSLSLVAFWAFSSFRLIVRQININASLRFCLCRRTLNEKSNNNIFLFRFISENDFLPFNGQSLAIILCLFSSSFSSLSSLSLVSFDVSANTRFIFNFRIQFLAFLFRFGRFFVWFHCGFRFIFESFAAECAICHAKIKIF